MDSCQFSAPALPCLDAYTCYFADVTFNTTTLSPAAWPSVDSAPSQLLVSPIAQLRDYSVAKVYLHAEAASTSAFPLYADDSYAVSTSPASSPLYELDLADLEEELEVQRQYSYESTSIASEAVSTQASSTFDCIPTDAEAEIECLQLELENVSSEVLHVVRRINIDTLIKVTFEPSIKARNVIITSIGLSASERKLMVDHVWGPARRRLRNRQHQNTFRLKRKASKAA